MAGMMWRQCVILLVFLAGQISSAKELINLLERRVTRYAPQTSLEQIDSFSPKDIWEVMDGDVSTYAEVFMSRVRFDFWEGIRPSHFRITLARHVRKRDIPEDWSFSNSHAWTNFRGEDFVNGVFEGKFKNPKRTSWLRLGAKPNGHKLLLPIAEIELLGARKALNELWPHGRYPCSQRLEMITPKTGPKGRLFSVAKNAVSNKELRSVFTGHTRRRETPWDRPFLPDFKWDGTKPIIIGVEFAKAPKVLEVMVHGVRFFREHDVQRIVLQGHRCQPNCNDSGSKGWVILGEEQTLRGYCYTCRQTPFYLKKTGKYKAYRVVFYPRKNFATLSSMSVRSIYFLGCKK